MIDFDVVQLSRLQFALTALYHFLFVPLTIGLAVLLAIMESVYVMTGRVVWRDMTKFWGVLFGINFAMGVATGITMEFQFGTNWAYYSHYVGDIFGVPLAIEGMMAFFLEATFVGLFFFGWERLSKLQHLAATWMVAIGTNLSALWILIANGWMQNPVGAAFNIQTMRMEATSFYEIFFNPVAQVKFVHTVAASYVTGAVFVLSISAWYLLRGRCRSFARRSMTVATSFGLASSLAVAVLGDESGYVATEHQKMKLAAIEAMWTTEFPPAGFTLVGLPDTEDRTTHYAVHVPWVLGLIATRSFDTEVPGIIDLVGDAAERIRRGREAYGAMQVLRRSPDNVRALDVFERTGEDLGYGLLLRRYTDRVTDATEEQVLAAARDTVPDVPVLFWSFRIMVACGVFFILLFAVGFVLASTRRLERHPSFLRAAVLALPLPWVAAELGWVVAEYGRQPWVIEGVLPTFLGVSSVSAGEVWMSLIGFAVFYTALAVVDGYLLVKYIRLGPDGWSSEHAPAPPSGVAASNPAGAD